MRTESDESGRHGKSRAASLGLLLAACMCHSSPARSETQVIEKYRPGAAKAPATHLLKRSQLTAEELKFGRAPDLSPGITYRRDVVIVGGGPHVIRAIDPSRRSCTFDARAAGAGNVKVGSVAFVSSNCVGRVIALKPQDGNLTAVLGPVQLTDVFQDLEVDVNEPIDLNETVAYAAPNSPQLTTPIENASEADFDDGASPPTETAADTFLPPTGRPLSFVPVADIPAVPGTSGILPMLPQVRWQADKPLLNADGVGMQFEHQQWGVFVRAQAQIKMAAPNLEFYLSIHGSSVNARIILHNAVGLKMAFDSGANEYFNHNVNWYLPGLAGFNIPIGVGALSIDVRQEMFVQTEFTGKLSILNARGEYGINADVGLIYNDGHLQPVGPKTFSVVVPALSTLNGVSLRPAKIRVGHKLIITGGLGALGFTAGPSVQLATWFDASSDSSIGLIKCQSVGLSLQAKAGVGWTIPRILAAVVNLIFALVDAPQVNDHGGVYTSWMTLFAKRSTTESAVCRQ